MMARRVLLVGATGTFGSRLAALLAKHAEVELILAARGTGALEALRASLVGNGARARILVRSFDRLRPPDLSELSPWLVVDAAGPFQGSDYRLAQAAVRHGAHYVDLADARDFVAGFPDALDESARQAGVLAVTAASSTPALSQAALDHLVEGWRAIDEIVVAISPGARAPRGLSVIEAILSYVGQPVRAFRNGTWQIVRGWSGQRMLYMPGLGWRWGSICETPDLDLLARRFPVRSTALFMAGLELPVMHHGLTLLSLPVHWGIIRSLRSLARPIRTMADALAAFGSDRGGMIVEAIGRDKQDRPIRARWALAAEANSGPNTPAAPAAALIRALLEGREMTRGATACVGLLDQRDILRELAHLPISTRVDDGLPQSNILFERLLGNRWATLPACIKTVHGGEHQTLSGRAVARSGKNVVAKALRWLQGLPRTGPHDVEVMLNQDNDGEKWVRRFGNSSFSSRLCDAGPLGLFEERFGPLRFKFDLQPTPNGISWEFCGWSFGGLALPSRLAPRIRAGAEDTNGFYRFRVVVSHRLTGLLFAYRGTLIDRPHFQAPPA